MKWVTVTTSSFAQISRERTPLLGHTVQHGRGIAVVQPTVRDGDSHAYPAPNCLPPDGDSLHLRAEFDPVHAHWPGGPLSGAYVCLWDSISREGGLLRRKSGQLLDHLGQPVRLRRQARMTRIIPGPTQLISSHFISFHLVSSRLVSSYLVAFPSP